MSFVPPTFGNLGKKVTDLFKKKFEYNNTVTSKSKTTAGVTLESTGSVGFVDAKKMAGGYIATGTQKITYKCTDFEGEATLKTLGFAEGSLKFPKLAKNAVVTVKGGTDEKPFEETNKGELYASAEAEYTQNNFALSLLLKGSQSNTLGATASAVVGIDGLSVGGRAYAERKATGVMSYNGDVGVELVRSGVTGAFLTEKTADVIKASVWTQRGATQVGAEFAYDGTAKPAPKKVFTFGIEHVLDADTNLKAKLDNTGDFHAVVSHQLANPSMQISFASNYKLDFQETVKSLKAKNFGLAFTFGDL